MEITTAELEAKITEAARLGAIEAIRAANVPDAGERPGGAGKATILVKKAYRPSITKACRASRRGNWKGAELERDLSQAVRAVYKLTPDDASDDPDDGFQGEAFAWPADAQAMRDVLEAADIKTDTPFGEFAVRALTEGTGSITVTGAGNLVPPQFLSSAFETVLQPNVIVPQIPGATELPVTSNVVYLPYESARGTFYMAAEAGTLSTYASDSTLTNQSITLRKGYVYHQYSNELLADANPALDRYIQNLIQREMALGWDEEFLQGDGSSYSIYGILNYGSVATMTTGPSLGSNGRTPTVDDFIQLAYVLNAANAMGNFFAMHPRTLNTLAQLKDAEGRYVLPNIRETKQLLGLPILTSTQISITTTTGTSTDTSYVIHGDGNFLKTLTRQAIEVMASPHVAFTSDQTAIRATRRAGLAITQPLAFSVMTGVRP